MSEYEIMSEVNPTPPPSEHAAPGFWDANSKTMFFTGLFLGLAVSSSVALIVLLGVLWSGKPLGGAVAKAADTPTVAAADQPTEQPTTPAQPVKAATDQDHVLGNKDAKVTLIVYSDFECPFCARFEPTLKETLTKYPKDVKVVFRNYPLTQIHQYAQKAAEAAECVAKLGGNNAYWKMHDKLFAITTEAMNKNAGAVFTTDVLATAAGASGVDKNKFKTCLDSGEMAAKVTADAATGDDAGVQGTPATFINGKLVSGALPFANFEPELKTAGATQ